jgi:hypothetical protein
MCDQMKNQPFLGQNIYNLLHIFMCNETKPAKASDLLWRFVIVYYGIYTPTANFTPAHAPGGKALRLSASGWESRPEAQKMKENHTAGHFAKQEKCTKSKGV